MKRKLRSVFLMLLFPAILGFGVAAVSRFRGTESAAALPTAPARKVDFSVLVRCRGELKAQRSVQITAPVNVPELRLVWLAPTGGSVKTGDPVARFDPSAVRQELQEKQAALKQAQAALDQSIAQARIDTQQSQIDLKDAGYAIEKAKLQVLKTEMLSPLQAEEAKIDLGLAEEQRKIQQAKIALAVATSEAKTAALRRARDKAKDELDLSNYRLAQMELKAPIAGWVSYLPNYSQGWMNAKPFKIGDQVWPGAAVAELPDLDSLEMEGKIEEIDRGRIAVGQEVRVRIDALPERTLPARLAMLSPMTVMGWEWPPTRTFRGFARLEKIDPRLRPSMNGAMDVVVNRIPGAISIPVKALFTVNGKPTVYAAEKGGPRPIEVTVLARNPDEVAVQGLREGAMVTLVEPDLKERRP